MFDNSDLLSNTDKPINYHISHFDSKNKTKIHYKSGLIMYLSSRGVTLYTNGVARATPSKKSATPSLRLPPHHMAPYTGRPRVMKAPARTKEHTHGQKVPEEARNGRKTGRVKQEA